MWLVSSEVGQ